MKLNHEQIKAYYFLRKRLEYEQLQNRLAFLCFGLAFISFLFIQTLTVPFMVGTMVLFSHTLIGKSMKQLLTISETMFNSEPENIIKMKAIELEDEL